MHRTYRSTVFACFYFGILLFIAAFWWFLRGRPEMNIWGPLLLLAFGILGLPFLRAKVELDKEGITQQILRRRFVRWSDVLSWKRVGHPSSDGPDTLTIRTRAGSFTLNHNCIYGKRLDELESELRRKSAQAGAATESQPSRPEAKQTSSAAGSRR